MVNHNQYIYPRAPPSQYSGVHLNPGSSTVYASSMNDMRRSVTQAARSNGDDPAGYFTAENLPGMIKDIGDQESQRDTQINQAKFLQSLAMQAAGRGVNKALFTPAQQNGVVPQNPQFFGLEAKAPIPYQKIILDKQNLQSVLRGYSAQDGTNGQTSAALLLKVQKQQSLLNDAFNTKKNNSIYAGVSESSAKNLYEINLMNLRKNSIYALQ